MLFRRVSKHVKDQNWFAVGIDFFIVVFGIFIGLQVANWNEARQDKQREKVILTQLSDEFKAIKTQLEDEVENAQERLAATKHVVWMIDSETPTDNSQTKLALIRNMGLGRVPSSSATYQQLVSNGDLTLIQNDELRKVLIQYHDNIDKNEFLFERTLESVSEFITNNQAFKVEVNLENFSDTNPDTISEIDWEALQAQRPYFVSTFIFNNLFYRFYRQELASAETIIDIIDKE